MPLSPFPTLAIALAALTLTGCQAARIDAPVTADAAIERLDLHIGGGGRGSFTLDQSPGRFRRWAQRSSLAGFVSKDGGGSFTLARPDGELTGRCRFDEESLKFGDGVSATTRPIVYQCGFERDGVPIAARLILRETEGGLSAATRYERSGWLDFEGERIALRSIHDIQGTRMPTITPLGYGFAVDGRQIGAIDLNGYTKTLFVPPEPRRREAVLAASLALAILWDPADTD